ncbi:Hypothetical protein NTJ_14054 [Nesidiocoris tenuis]|uniref:Uncharacterized protein n=1 Tax=Nesidiocoris tenuis TaxID=355587 RepID=A0ABN7BDH2_9HEMI|nr:Hypothetical protein NTJ_14054 [Nesidiocoris tenuis]
MNLSCILWLTILVIFNVSRLHGQTIESPTGQKLQEENFDLDAAMKRVLDLAEDYLEHPKEYEEPGNPKLLNKLKVLGLMAKQYLKNVEYKVSKGEL